jgi:hypothetical protein
MRYSDIQGDSISVGIRCKADGGGQDQNTIARNWRTFCAIQSRKPSGCEVKMAKGATFFHYMETSAGRKNLMQQLIHTLTLCY